MNKAIMIGNLGHDPSGRTLDDGTQVASYTLAIPAGRDKDPQWVNVTCWRKDADNCLKYLHKGSKVAVIGKVTARSYTRRDGSAAASLELSAESVEFLGSPREQQTADQRTDQQTGMDVVDPDDLPY